MKNILIFALLINVCHANNNPYLKINPYSGETLLRAAFISHQSIGLFNDMKLIPISIKSKTISGKYFAQVDDEDYQWLMKYTWTLARRSHIFYATTRIEKGRGGKQESMHRMILGLKDKNIHGEHEDHNGLNNQRYNLRKATMQQNMFNASKRFGKTSKYKGVSKTRDGKWMATITKDGKTHYLGRHKTPEDAATAYDTNAKELFGEFANLNFK